MIKDLVLEETAINDTMYELRKQIVKKEMEKDNFECDLWMNTDFGKLGLTNADQRKAYVKKELSLLNNQIAELKNELNYAEHHLKAIRMKERICLEMGIDVLE